MIATQGCIKAHPAVMLTKPLRAPLRVIVRSKIPSPVWRSVRKQFINSDEMAPVAEPGEVDTVQQAAASEQVAILMQKVPGTFDGKKYSFSTCDEA